MATKEFYQVIRPSLDINFANSRTVDPRITFSRAGTGNAASSFDSTGVMKFYPPNTPRLEFDPVSLECKGILSEEQRSNLLTYSEQFTNAVWQKGTSVVVSANSQLAPDGATTADTITADSGQGLFQTVSASAGSAYTVSCFVKAGTASSLMLADNLGAGRYIVFSTLTWTVTETFGSLLGYGVSPVGNGWYRVYMSYTADSSQVQCKVISNSTELAKTFNLWGTQLELGQFPTTYTKTESSQVTRSSDVAFMSGTNFSSWFRQDEGTIFVEGAIIDGGTANRGLIRIDDGTESNRFMIRRNGENRIEARLITNDVSVVLLDSVNTTITVGQNIKAAFSYKANDFAFSMNGIPALTDTSGGLPTFTRFLIGDASGTSDSQRASTIKRIAFYPKALPSYLQTMTM